MSLSTISDAQLITAGFDTDWQVLVEMECDLAEQERRTSVIASHIELSIEKGLHPSTLGPSIEADPPSLPFVEKLEPTRPNLWQPIEEQGADDELVGVEDFVLKNQA
jgi:hypothetical protein